MKNYVATDSAGRRLAVEADSFSRDDGYLVFYKDGTVCAALAAGQWVSVQETTLPATVESTVAKNVQ